MCLLGLREDMTWLPRSSDVIDFGDGTYVVLHKCAVCGDEYLLSDTIQEINKLIVDPKMAAYGVQYLCKTHIRSCFVRVKGITDNDIASYLCDIVTEIASGKWLGACDVNVSRTRMRRRCGYMATKQVEDLRVCNYHYHSNQGDTT